MDALVQFLTEATLSVMQLFRKTISIILLPVCVLLFALPTRSQLPPETWSQFRGGHQLMGVSVSNVPRDLKVLWTYEAGESIESSAAIVNGAVYVGSQSGYLSALNLSDGSVRWKYKASGPIGESSPCVAGGTVFIGDLNGMLHAVRTSDGKAVWTFKTGGEIKSSPVVVGDRVLIGSYDEHLYCVSSSNGSLLWKVRSNGPIHCTAGVSRGMAYVAGCDEVFRAVRIADGKEMYQIASGAYTGASPALVGQKAYYGTFNNEVLAVNLTTRRIAWRYRNRKRQFPYYSSAAVAEGKVVVGGRDKMVHCIDAATGRELWTFMTRARVESSPAIADGRAFVGSNDGMFYVFDYKTGAKVWEFNAGGPLSASPAIAAGRVVIGSEDGRLYCFGQ